MIGVAGEGHNLLGGGEMEGIMGLASIFVRCQERGVFVEAAVVTRL